MELRPQLDVDITPGTPAAVTVRFNPISDRAFAAELLPQPRWLYESREIDAAAWFARLAPRVFLPLIEKSVINRPDVRAALDFPLLDASLAKLLLALKLLRTDDRLYRLGEWSAFASLDAPKLLDALLATITADAQQAESDGVHFVALKNGTATDYGLRIRMKDVALGGKDGGGATLQAGSWLTGETDADNWLTASGGPLKKTPGAEVIVCRKPASGPLTFDAARIDLTSVGLDVAGKAMAGGGHAPLFEAGGYALRRLKSRVYLSLGAGRDPQFGAAVELNDLSLALGPTAGGESASANPVAANLLGPGPQADGAPKDAANPAFSAVAAYAGKFHGKVFVSNGTPSADGKVWIPVARSFGPLRCKQIGFGLDQDTFDVGYDGSVSLSNLNIGLEHLTIGIPLHDPGNVNRYHLDLDGLNFSLATEAVQVSGGLSKVKGEDGKPRYDGMALVKAKDMTITGFGSYGMAGGAPSLFIFAVLHKDLGGPAFFHVTGIAAGFGFNRALLLPPVEEVQHFPLVRAALDPSYLQSTPDALSTALALLRDYIPPSRGDYWLAVGVRFSSFEMIQSFALLSISFGNAEPEIGLLGISTMSVPKGAKPGEAVAFAELALRAVIKPAEGVIAVEGRLTDKSYIFSPECHLTGGFAFFSWFSGVHAGDFVITIGGYHPRFVAPSHYPTVPRLAIQWRVSNELSITGEMYYALTPSCLMAGGRMCAVYQSGPIQAWFTAYAHFLLNWQPFYYQIEMGVLIGVACSVRVSLGFCSFTLALRVEVGVDLRLWGPPFAGEVYVRLSVISFTIRFGAGRTTPKPLDADRFIETCLPPASRGGLLQADASSVPQADVISIRIGDGLLREQRLDDGSILRTVNAHALALTAQSVIPATGFAGFVPGQVEDPSRFGIRPMGRTALQSTITVSLSRARTPGAVAARMVVSPITTGVPDALWGKSDAPGAVALPGTPTARTIPATVGVRLTCAAVVATHTLAPIEIEKLKYDDLPSKPVYWRRLQETAAIEAHGARTLANTVWRNADVDARRRAVLGVIAGVSPFELYQPHLERLATSSGYFQAQPDFACVEAWAPRGSAVA